MSLQITEEMAFRVEGYKACLGGGAPKPPDSVPSAHRENWFRGWRDAEVEELCCFDLDDDIMFFGDGCGARRDGDPPRPPDSVPTAYREDWLRGWKKADAEERQNQSA